MSHRLHAQWKQGCLLMLCTCLVLSLLIPLQEAEAASPRQMEYLDRGLVAVQTNDGVFVSWRLLGTDPQDISFNLYRNGVKINAEPIAASTNYLDSGGNSGSIYSVAPVVNGEEQAQSDSGRRLESAISVASPAKAAGRNDAGRRELYVPCE